jgi:hypothetical protein
MLRVALLVWIMLGTTLAGIAVMVVLATPSLSADAKSFIPWAAAIGAVVALPISYVVAGMITRRMA